MTEEQRDDERELNEARQARKAADKAAVKTEAVVGVLHRASDGIGVIVDRNGYLERFRELLRGA